LGPRELSPVFLKSWKIIDYRYGQRHRRRMAVLRAAISSKTARGYHTTLWPSPEILLV
jgi:hypothetical protein